MSTNRQLIIPFTLHPRLTVWVEGDHTCLAKTDPLALILCPHPHRPHTIMQGPNPLMLHFSPSAHSWLLTWKGQTHQTKPTLHLLWLLGITVPGTHHLEIQTKPHKPQ